MNSLYVESLSKKELQIIAEMSKIKLEKGLEIFEIYEIFEIFNILNEYYDEVHD